MNPRDGATWGATGAQAGADTLSGPRDAGTAHRAAGGRVADPWERSPVIVHPFAGIGWSEALRCLGLTDIGLEINPTACDTRTGAGHNTIQCDVAQYPTAEFAGADGDIFGPPCPPFSRMGKGAGAHDLPHIYSAIDDLAAGRDTRAEHGAQCQDERSILTAEPMRWIHDLRPRWVLMEQVPSVLPVWERYAKILTAWGYSTATGVRDCARYGLHSHRPRAFFAASLDREMVLPEYTHGGEGQPPLAVMADCVGWGYTDRPAPTVTGGGVNTGGAEPFGNGSRQAMKRAMGTDRWKARGVPHLRPTIAEAAALNGFRPDLVFHGGAGQQYLAIGNAVPPPVAQLFITAATGITTADRIPVQLELDLTAA